MPNHTARTNLAMRCLPPRTAARLSGHPEAPRLTFGAVLCSLLCALVACGGGGGGSKTVSTGTTSGGTGNTPVAAAPAPLPAPTPTPEPAPAPAPAPAADANTLTCGALPPMPSVPASARLVTDFGAIANDNLADDTAISNALAALKPGEWLVFPAGKYIQNHSVVIATPDVTVWGAGAELHATDPQDHTVSLQADGVRLYGFKLTAVTDIRRSAVEQARISIYRDITRPGLQTGNVVRGNTVTFGDTADTANSAGGAGILVSKASNFTVAENTIRRSLADGINIADGSRNGRVVGNTVRETGDDMISVGSFFDSGWQSRFRTDPTARGAAERGDTATSNIAVQNNDLADNYWGRGISVIGARDVTVRDNLVNHTAMAAGILVAQEGLFNSPGPRNALVQSNRIYRVQAGAPPYLPAGPAFAERRDQVLNGAKSGHGAIEVHAIDNAASDASDPLLAPLLTLQDIKVTGNDIADTSVDGIRIGVTSIATLMQRISASNNTLRNVTGAPVNNLLGDSASVSCSGNTASGKAASSSCKAVVLPEVTGAKLNCGLIP